MPSFRILQLKRRRFGPFWYKTTSFYMLEQFFFFFFNTRAVQNDVVLDCGSSKRRRFETVLNHLSKTTSFG